jgi:hypothetical protein
MNNQPRLDREIVRLIDSTHEKGCSSIDIQTGTVMIDGIRVNFAAKSLADDRLRMILPADFRSIPPEQLYKPEARPDRLWADETGAVQITVTHTRKKVGNDAAVAVYQNEVRKILQILNSSLEWQAGGVKEVRGKQVAYFEFITPMLGARIYNLTFFLDLQGRIFTGSFVCPELKLKVWKGIFDQMLESVEVSAGETGNLTNTHPNYCDYHFNQGLYLIHQGHEYLSFQIGADRYRLISLNSADLQNGFLSRDGVFKKTVGRAEIEAAYELKLILTYRGYSFEMGQQSVREIQLILRNCDPDIRERLQMQTGGSREYEKWVNKAEIENVEVQRLPVEGFAMPESLS